MKKYLKLFIMLLLVSFILPQVVLASWWNPFSWFANKDSAQIETEVRVQQEIQDTSDQSAMIEQLNKTITELEKQIEEYKCPACVSNTVQCPVCKPQIITKEVPVEKIVQATCPTCPVCQTASNTPLISANPTPLTASCSIKIPYDPNKPMQFIVEPTGGVGDGLYYYTWKNYDGVLLSECGGVTVSPSCWVNPSSIESSSSLRRGVVKVEVRSGEQKFTIQCPKP